MTVSCVSGRTDRTGVSTWSRDPHIGCLNEREHEEGSEGLAQLSAPSSESGDFGWTYVKPSLRRFIQYFEFVQYLGRESFMPPESQSGHRFPKC